MLRGLEGKVALVTGAGAGIGEASARRLREEGARVVLLDLDSERVEAIASELGPDALGLAADVSSEEDVAAAIASARERYGRLDLAFLNAGISGPMESLADSGVESFDRVVAVNLRGCYLTMRAVLQVLLEQGSGGSIVATASMLSLQGGPLLAPYTATKHAIVGLVRAAALEVGGEGIRVNALCPGYIDTNMLRAFQEGLDDPEAVRAQTMKKNAMGRFGEPEEMAAMVAWLLSDEASYCSGGCFSVDGAITAGESLTA